MTSENYRKRSRWLQFRESTDGPREYETVRRLKQEGNAEVLDRKVRTSQEEIIQMARVVDAADGDARRFLKILRQDAECLGVYPEEVYTDGLGRNDKWAHDLTIEEVGKLRSQSHIGYKYGNANYNVLSVSDPEATVQRLSELYEFLDVASEIELAPRLYQG